MSDNPKFEVIDRRKIKAEEEHDSPKPEAEGPSAPAAEPAPSGGPRLVVNDERGDPAAGAATESAAEAPDVLPPEPIFSQATSVRPRRR